MKNPNLMATNVDVNIDAHVNTECTPLIAGGQGNTSDTRTSERGSFRITRPLILGKLPLHLVCSGYSSYLIWLLANLKDNNYYWFLGSIPFLFNFAPFLFFCKAFYDNNIPEICKELIIREPSVGVVFNLMACFTMLTRHAYYHSQPDEFIGPGLTILSLKASIILFFANFYLRRGNMDRVIEDKDVLARLLFDFVDIFNMVEILSVHDCVGLGKFVSEESSTEIAIQTFCTLSFVIVLLGMASTTMISELEDGYLPERRLDERNQQPSQRRPQDSLHSALITYSGFYQNFPFFVIRIVIWAQYNRYSLGFLLKNALVVILWIKPLYQEIGREWRLLGMSLSRYYASVILARRAHDPSDLPQGQELGPSQRSND